MRQIILLVALVLVAGCFNGGNSNVRLGDVSLGQQLIDLKRALEEDAVTTEEYERAKSALMAASALCEPGEGEHEDDDDGIDWF